MRRMTACTCTLLALMSVVPTRAEAQAAADSARQVHAASLLLPKTPPPDVSVVSSPRRRVLQARAQNRPTDAGRHRPLRCPPQHTGRLRYPRYVGDRSDDERRRALGLGATALWGVGGAGSFRTGLRARYRWWLNDTTSVEAAAGPLWMTVKDARGASGIVVSADLRLNFSDKYALSGRLDRVSSGDFAAGHAMYVGTSLGSKYVVVGTAVGLVLTIIGVLVAVAGTN